MRRLTCEHNWQSLNKGYALIALMITVTLILVSMTEALPGIYQEVQREREQEAIFRGQQYARAIYLFHRTVGRFPSSVKELLNTNGTRYLREAYPDPLSPTGRWHFVHASAAGIVIDSQNQTASSPGQPGAAPSFGSQPQPNNSTPSFGSSTQTGTSPSGFGPTPQAGGQSSISEQPITAGVQKKPPKPPADCQAPEESTSESAALPGAADSSSPAQTGELLGAFIVGVAVCGTQASVRVLDKKDHYYQWEFIGTNYLPYSLPKVQVVEPASSFPTSQPGQPQPMGTSPNSAVPTTQGTPQQPSQNQNPGGIQ